MRLRDKVCVITGTGGGIGRAAALCFAREGALVVGCDVNPEPAQETVRLVRTAGGKMVSFHPAELGTVRDCQRVIDLAVREFGRVDVLFNNAAMAHFNVALFLASDESSFVTGIDVKVDGGMAVW